MTVKSLKLNFQAPIIFNYSYEIDLDEIEEDSVETYISKILTENMQNIADSMYQSVKEELSWYIEKNISLKEVEKKY